MELEQHGEYSYVVQQINSSGWGILETPIEYVNIDIVKEFYVNAKVNDDALLARISWI